MKIFENLKLFSFRPDPVSAATSGSGPRHSWPQSPYSQISSPSLDSTGGDTNSSPTSPHSPPATLQHTRYQADQPHRSSSDAWQPGFSPNVMFSNFAPPNTVAPGPSSHGQSHRPDAVLGGGSHRYSALSARVCSDNNTPVRGGFELVQVKKNNLYVAMTKKMTQNHPYISKCLKS